MNHTSRVVVTIVIAILGALIAGMVVAILAKHDGKSYAGSALAGMLAGGATLIGIITAADQLHLTA